MQTETIPAKSVESSEVVILGSRFSVKSGFDPAFVGQTAKLVNERCQQIIRDSGVIAHDKVAILACLNLASELLKLEEDFKHTKERMEKRLVKLLSTLDTCLNQEEISYLSDSSKSQGA